MVNGKVKVNNKEISSIFWADDIVIFSENENGLRAMTKVLDQYATGNKIMICNKTGRLMSRLFFINGIQI